MRFMAQFYKFYADFAASHIDKKRGGGIMEFRFSKLKFSKKKQAKIFFKT